MRNLNYIIILAITECKNDTFLLKVSGLMKSQLENKASTLEHKYWLMYFNELIINQILVVSLDIGSIQLLVAATSGSSRLHEKRILSFLQIQKPQCQLTKYLIVSVKITLSP